MNWHFIDDEGTFQLPNPQQSNYLYFPLVNESGFTSVVTPMLHGDVKADHHSYLMPPVSVEDLHISRAARNFWVVQDGERPWSATGNSTWQVAQRFTPEEEEVTLTAGPLWQQITRENNQLGLRAEITNFVPAGRDRVELMRVKLTNISNTYSKTITPTAAVPIFGRSADNQRDHRHVTSLLHRIHTERCGIFVKPTLSFDERGHKPNRLTYAVLGVTGEGGDPTGFWPVLEEFIGEGGTLDWPQAVAAPSADPVGVGHSVDGYEALGGLRFPQITLEPGQSQSYILMLAIFTEGEAAASLLTRYGSESAFAASLADTRRYWAERIDAFQIRTGNPRFDRWLRWVTLQPILRRLCGNSYLPFHDYGRGGRGWRDLWQDALALLLVEPGEVRPLLLSSFAGVRLDGSNATIIGSTPGAFKADRNNIPRVWMDHGAWPLLTVEQYIDTTGDLDFLLEKQPYFKDRWTHRAGQADPAWKPEDAIQQLTRSGSVYEGTVLEHMLVQHLTAFYNVGEHNIIRLEGADWNDGLDMAEERGESVAFSALYADNLDRLSRLIMDLTAAGETTIPLAAELRPLFESCNYGSVPDKKGRLAAYFDTVSRTVSGDQWLAPAAELAAGLAEKAAWLKNHLREQEWLAFDGERGWYNGYYDNHGRRVEGDFPAGPRMTLTGQVFTLMGGVATETQAAQILRAADALLYDETVGGYRLNTDFGEVRLDLGRMFGFAFGHKENGAMFSHMAVMFANALYRQGFAAEGQAVLDGIFQHSQKFPVSRMYPGIPEYINARGRGVYPYLTGSASWYLLTVLNEMFGVRGKRGDLLIRPALRREQFDERRQVSLITRFAGRTLKITYTLSANDTRRPGEITAASLNGRPLPPSRDGAGLLIPRTELINHPENELVTLQLTVGVG